MSTPIVGMVNSQAESTFSTNRIWLDLNNGPRYLRISLRPNLRRR